MKKAIVAMFICAASLVMTVQPASAIPGFNGPTDDRIPPVWYPVCVAGGIIDVLSVPKYCPKV